MRKCQYGGNKKIISQWFDYMLKEISVQMIQKIIYYQVSKSIRLMCLEMDINLHTLQMMTYPFSDNQQSSYHQKNYHQSSYYYRKNCHQKNKKESGDDSEMKEEILSTSVQINHWMLFGLLPTCFCHYYMDECLLRQNLNVDNKIKYAVTT